MNLTVFLLMAATGLTGGIADRAWLNRRTIAAAIPAALTRWRAGRHPRPFTIPHRRRTAGRHERTTA